MSNQPIIFNIQYTPYSLPKSATKAEREQQADERAFFDMTGGKNVFDYITTEGKRTGKRTALEYLQKNTSVFNDRGMIPQEQVDEMKARLKENKGNIWHGFISLSAEESPKIDTPEKCIELIKRTFPSFLKDAKLRPDNIDLMCALHLDRPHHLHIHFVFWEKEPKFKDAKSGELRYRRRGKIDKKSIDGMFVRLGLFLSDRKDILYKSRDEAICDLRELLGAKVFICKPEDVKKEILALARDLPKEGRIAYGSKDMEPYRARVDHIVQMLLWTDRRARQADRRFHRALAGREREIANICGQSFVYAEKNVLPENMEHDLPRYHNIIDGKNIRIIEEIKADYKRRQGKTEIRRVELRKFLRAIPILAIGIVAALAAVGCASTEGAEPTKPSDARAEYTPVGYAFAVDGTCEHSYEAVQAITATCTDQGYTVYTCANCGDSYTDNFVAASGHAFQDITVPATCTHKGYVTHFCTVCGYEYSDTFVDEKGHSYLDEVIAPTCAEQGYTQHTCSVCGYSYRDSYVQAFGHNYTEAVTEPTCTDVGYTTHTCRTCGSEVISDYISPNWHLYEQTVHPATCVSYGYTEHVCSECGDRHVTDYQKAMGHTYLDIVVEATQDSLGYTRHLCIVCNYSYLSDFVTSGDDGYIEKEPVHEHQYELQVQDFEADQYFIALRVCICGDSRVGNLNIQFSDANGETVQLSPNEYGQVDYSGLYGEWLVTILDEKGEQLTVFDFSAGEAPEEPTEPDLPDEGAEPGEPPVVGDEEQSDEEIVQGPSDEGEGPTEPETPDDDGEQENPDEGETPEELQEPADETAGSGSGTAIILLIVFLLLVVGGVVAVIFLKKKKNKGQN